MAKKDESSPRILLFDIETSPIVATVWGVYEQNVIWKEEEWHITCFAYKWLDEKKINCVSLTDFPKEYKKNPRNDFHVVKKLRELLNEADIVIAHNGDEFDIKKSQARMAYHHMKPPSLFVSIDTKKVAKKYFKFDANSQGALLEYFGLGQKMDTGGYELWKSVRDGDPKAWKKMREYNMDDVAGLELIYLHMRPWMRTHPVVATSIDRCPNCNSNKLHADGIYRSAAGLNYKKWECQSCGACPRSRIRT